MHCSSRSTKEYSYSQSQVNYTFPDGGHHGKKGSSLPQGNKMRREVSKEKQVNEEIRTIKAMSGMLGGRENTCGWQFMMELLPLGYHCIRQ